MADRREYKAGIIMSAAFVAREGQESLAVELLRAAGLASRKALLKSKADQWDVHRLLSIQDVSDG